MFFEASRFGCRKKIFDATKVTYNTYSCATRCMGREIMEMDGRDSAKCRKSKLRDKMVILEFVLNDNMTNIVIVPSSCFKLKSKTGNKGGTYSANGI